MEATTPRPRSWKTLLAFAIIYFVWGSTFLGIRIGVREVPPFLFAGIRFFTAGALLYFWMRVKGTPRPTRREWSSLLLLALLIFVMDYGLLFWAEQTVPSGVAAVMMATIPVFMALAEIFVLRTQRMTLRLALALGEAIDVGDRHPAAHAACASSASSRRSDRSAYARIGLFPLSNERETSS